MFQRLLNLSPNVPQEAKLVGQDLQKEESQAKRCFPFEIGKIVSNFVD